jgi:hypothetical protein
VNERAGLLGLLDRYLEALAAHEPARVQLASGIRSTENGQELPLGEGRWRTIRSVEPGGQRFADSESGQVAWWGAATEVAGPIMLGIRLRADDGRISESETIVIRPGGALFNPESLAIPRSMYEEIVEPSARSSREELVRVANLYFDGIEQNDGRLIPVVDGCVRIENGVQTTRNEDAGEGDPDMPWRYMGVADQISAGHFRYIDAIRQRRFPVVDEERGLVLAHASFDHPGDIETVDGRIPFGFPNSVLICEVFKVIAGKIHGVEALGTVFPYRMSMGWG